MLDYPFVSYSFYLILPAVLYNLSGCGRSGCFQVTSSEFLTCRSSDLHFFFCFFIGCESRFRGMTYTFVGLYGLMICKNRPFTVL